MNGRVGVLVRVWLLAALFVAGCTAPPTPIVISDVDATQTALAPTPAAAPSPVEAIATPGGVLRLGVAFWRGFDPLAAVNAGTEQAQALIYETLLAYDPQGGLVPLLAAGLPISGSGGLIWTVELRPGVAFHDGAALDASLAAEALQRALAAGVDEAALPESVRVFRRLVETIGAEGMTLAFHLREPFAAFPSLLAEQALALTHGPGVGSGPFWLPDGVPGADAPVALARYDGYHGGAALVERVEVRPVMQEADGGAVIMESADAAPPDIVAGESLPLGSGPEGYEVWSAAMREQWLLLSAGHAALLPVDVITVLALALDGPPEAYRDALAEIGLPDGFDLAISATAGQTGVEEGMARFAPVHVQAAAAGGEPDGGLIAAWTRDWERGWWLRAAGYAAVDVSRVGVRLQVEPVVTYVRPGLAGLGVTSGGWARITAQTAAP